MSSTRRGTLWLSALLVAAPFLHAQSVSILPANPTIGAGTNFQFTKQTTMLSPETVNWSVGGVLGGNATVGTIDSTGLYHAPATPPGQNPVMLTATSTAMPNVSGSTYAYIVPAGPTITAVTPNPLPSGSYNVTVTGAGFLSGASIMFGGVQVSTSFVNSTTLSGPVYQPAGQTSVSVCVRNPGTQCGNTLVIPTGTPTVTVTVKPANPSVQLGASVQLSVTTAGLPNSNVTWSVGGMAGGNATVGTISATGLYTAPMAMPANAPMVTALSTADGKTSGSTYIYLLTAGPTITSATPNPLPSGSFTVMISGSGFQAGAMVFNGGVQLSTVGAPTAASITAAGYLGPATSTTFCVRNPGSVCSNVLVVPVTASTTNSGGGSPPPPSSAPTVLPAAVTLVLGGTQQFTGTNTTSWSAVSGTITAAGLYTAPAVMPATSKDTVTATGAGGTASATVTLIPNTPPSITQVTPPSLPLGVFSLTVNGTGFIPQSVVQLNGKALTTVLNGGTLTVSGFAGTPGQGNLTVINGPLSSPQFPIQVGVANPVVSASAARRFLEQAAFGPTPADAAHVQSVGFQQWLTEQFNMPQVSFYNGVGSQGGMPTLFLANAVTNPDQLRQRVAFALSEIFVTSITKLIWNSTMVPYQHMLLADAFTNYPQILNDVTLSPAMGDYLDMANNAKANPAAGTAPNENFAREVLQLFSIGPNLLNQDGTNPVDASNLPIPSYNQFTITEFARAFTGWMYAAPPGGSTYFGGYMNNSISPMIPFPPQHDSGAKTLLNGYVAPAMLAGQNAQAYQLQDFANTLNNIATHPNVAPFISKQLIQHLVKSNPTPAYVSRVAAIFTQTNGDIKSVVSAILLDQEARANDAGGADLPADGHLQEPALFLPGFVRAFGGQMTSANFYGSDMAAEGQDIFNPASVFNYFSPGYTVAGTGGLKGPEFQINNPNAAILRENLVATLFNQYSNPIQSYGPGTSIDLTPFLSLATTPATLVDAIDLTLTHGTMPAPMKTIIVNAVTADPNSNLHRVQTAIYLTLQSSYYNVWH
jgi:hypothetical protein